MWLVFLWYSHQASVAHAERLASTRHPCIYSHHHLAYNANWLLTPEGATNWHAMLTDCTAP